MVQERCTRPALCPGISREGGSMEKLGIERVIVGSGSEGIKSEPEVVPVYCREQGLHEGLQCVQCLITFSDARSKERHVRNCHRDEYKRYLQQKNAIFTCYNCEKSFSSSVALSEHQATHSSQEKPFSCENCQKELTTYRELNHHKRYECTGRRYPCSDCGALFLTKQGRWNHRFKVHPDGTVGVGQMKTFQCHNVLQSKEEQLNLQKDCATEQSGEVKLLGKKCGERTNTEEHSSGANVKKFKQGEEVAEEEGRKRSGI